MQEYSAESTELEVAGKRYTGESAEVYTADERPGVVLLRQGRYTIQLDELEREALKHMTRAERRRYAAEHRKVARPRHR